MNEASKKEKEALRTVIRNQLEFMIRERKSKLKNEDIDTFINFIEDEFVFYEDLMELLSDWIEEFLD